MNSLKILHSIRSFCSKRETLGIEDKLLIEFLDKDPRLGKVIEQAYKNFVSLKKKYAKDLQLDEKLQVQEVQKHFVNFYHKATINPYVSIAACGPWVVTSCGAVVHDSGGYGMLGFGHGPEFVEEALCDPTNVMANIMTANYSQKKLSELLLKEIGHTRPDSKKGRLSHFICLNSGSESVSMAMRLADLHAHIQINTKTNSPHHNKKLKYIALEKSFHGRTDFPAQVSDSCLANYKKHLASFHARDNLITVRLNNLEDLEKAFVEADKNNIYIPAMLMEPVMGEGSPGLAITPEFYQLARNLTKKYDSLLIIDSIQAGIRAHGCLSVLDYPGFQDLEVPDCETYSKALNAGQYPFSVIAMNDKTASLYKTGIYGNTMTTNPRALAVACSVLKRLTPEIRNNINKKGKEFVMKGKQLANDFPKVVTYVQGTGLLCAIGINPDFMKVIGEEGLEVRIRKLGVGVIHGGENALRFTPPFDITSAEIDLIFSVIRKLFNNS